MDCLCVSPRVSGFQQGQLVAAALQNQEGVPADERVPSQLGRVHAAVEEEGRRLLVEEAEYLSGAERCGDFLDNGVALHFG